MSSILKIKSNYSTYVDSGHANSNFSDSRNLFAGSYHKTSCSSIIFKSLITFDLDNLLDSPLSYAYLCLYVKDCNSDTSYYSNNFLSLYRNTTDYDYHTTTWNNSPCTDSPIHFSVQDYDVHKYMKINITPIVNSWIKNKDNFGITVEANNFYSSLVKFASNNSPNPPWLIIQYKNPSYESNYDHNYSVYSSSR